MFWAVLSSTLLSAAPQQAIVVTRFRLVQVDPSLGGYAEDRLAARLAARGFQVSTPADLETMLGLERQRQLLGCSDDTSCLAEIGAAFGVPLVATGPLTRLGKRLELDVRVIRQKDGRVAASDTRATEDESRLGELLEQAADAIATLLPSAPATPFRWRLWVPLALGVASLAGAGALIGTAEAEAVGELSTGRGLGIGVGVLRAAFIASGIIWNALTPDAPVTVAVSFAPNATAVMVGGRF